jgi:hypothetical protein
MRRAQYIGRGMMRMDVPRKIHRERMRKMPEVRIEGERVYFPSWMLRSIEMIMTRHRRLRRDAEQIEMGI